MQVLNGVGPLNPVRRGLRRGLKGGFQEQKQSSQFLVPQNFMCDLCNCFGSRWCDFVSSCEEAPAAAEHYFWCMLGMPGVERGLQPSGPVPFPLPQSKARPQPSSKQRTTPTPSRQSPSRPRMMLPRKRKRSSNTTPTHHKRQRSSTPEKVRPERPAHRDVVGEDSWQYARAAGTQLGGGV